jgi:hypothetical protein
MKLLEKQVEKMLVDACKKKSYRCIKGSTMNNVGFPDRVVFNTDTQRIFFVEVKNETSYKLTVPQQIWKDMITRSGGEFFHINGEKEMETFINTFIKGEEK